jgi:hypothetical protein
VQVALHRPRSLVAVASISLVTLTGFDAAQAVPRHVAPTPNVVEGTVKTIDGRPVPGATIRIAGATGAARGTAIRATTDANGRYRAKVPLGHYNVDGFADIEYEGQNYKELWLDRGDAPCERVMSDKGIVRNFVLRLSGPKRCTNGLSPNNPDAYNGAYITAMTSAFPDDAVITFNLTPLGPLADGSKGRTISITRTGAALKKGGGPINETSFLHDIPLGRYRVAAEVRYANGKREGTTLELRDGGTSSGRTLDITFHANVFGGGIRPVGLGVMPGGAVRTEVSRLEPGSDAAQPVNRAVRENAKPAPPARPALPLGRYACSYRSQYAGDIPTGNSIAVIPGGRYQAYGGGGTYEVDSSTGTVDWTGPLGETDVRATFGRRNGQPAITVVGGPAAKDPDRTNFCVLVGS